MIIKRDERKREREREREFSDPPAGGEFLMWIIFVFMKRETSVRHFFSHLRANDDVFRSPLPALTRCHHRWKSRDSFVLLLFLLDDSDDGDGTTIKTATKTEQRTTTTTTRNAFNEISSRRRKQIRLAVRGEVDSTAALALLLEQRRGGGTRRRRRRRV